VPVNLKFFLAPLAGYTDLPFRNACRRYGCKFAFTPLIDSGSVVYDNPKNEKLLMRGKFDSWLGLQLLGNNPKHLAVAIKKLAKYKYDVIDFNMGCPVPKVIKRGCGAVLYLDLDLAVECLRTMVMVSSVPVTAKIRIISEDNLETNLVYAKRLEDTGISALTVHGRIHEKKYGGEVYTDIISEIREMLYIPVIANGGIFTCSDALDLACSTGCTQLMIARGAIGNPWIFREVCGGKTPSHLELCQELERHLAEMVEFWGEEVAMRTGRKIANAYLHGRGYRRQLRVQMAQIGCWNEFLGIVKQLSDEGPTDGYYKCNKGNIL